MDKIRLEKTSCGVIPVFVNSEGEKEFLLVELHHGGISFPKGHMEPGETYMETAIRELHEETGLQCDYLDEENMITETYVINRPEKIINKTVHYFIGHVSHQEVSPQEEEIRNFFWLQADDAMKKINHIESKEVLKKALSLLRA